VGESADVEKYRVENQQPVQGQVIGDYTTVHFYGSTSSTSPTPKPEPVWNVPYLRNPHFTGRDELLDQLQQQLTPVQQNEPAETRRVALTQPRAIKGLGGIGKTQIAVEYAYRSRDLNRYTHTLWVNAASEEAIITSLVSLAELLPAFSMKDEADQRKLVEAVKRWLEICEQRWLLIFDNADDLPIVQEYLPRKGKGDILLTTRANAVGSLAVSIEVEKMGLMEGTQLLLHRAGREGHSSDEEINEATNIVIALDHFPLALDQAGAFIEETGCSLVNYLQVYQKHRKELLARRGLQASNYPSSVATTWSLSFQKIEQANPTSAELLRLCAFLAPDAIPKELIVQGASNWGPNLKHIATNQFKLDQAVEELLKFSLIKRHNETEMFSIHRLVQVILKDTIKIGTQRQWAQRVVQAINTALPTPDLGTQSLTMWLQFSRYLSQAQTCTIHIKQYELISAEARHLLIKTAQYLNDYALYDEAARLYQHVLYIEEQVLESEHPETAKTLDSLAQLYYTQGKYEAAEQLYKRALHINEQKLGQENPETTTVLNHLAELCRYRGKNGEAEQLYKRALDINEQTLGAMHPETAMTLHKLAGLYRAESKYRESEQSYKRALHIREQVLGAEHPHTSATLNNLALLYTTQKKYKQAEQSYERALRISEQVLGQEHPETAKTLHNFAWLYYVQEKYEQAEQLYVRALHIHEKVLGQRHPHTAITLQYLARLYRDQGEYEHAEQFFKRALAIHEQVLTPEHPDVATDLENYAVLLRELRRNEEAEELEQRVRSIRTKWPVSIIP
jgi:tetratricopeptide (TPR) repeat protein